MATVEEIRKAMGLVVSEELAAKMTKMVEQEAAAIKQTELENESASAVHAIMLEAQKLVKVASVTAAVKELAGLFGEDRNVTITIPLADATGVLVSPLAKKKASGSGATGGSGKVKEKYGLSPAQIFDTYATVEEKAKLALLATDDKNGRFTLKDKVVQRAIANGLVG